MNCSFFFLLTFSCIIFSGKLIKTAIYTYMQYFVFIPLCNCGIIRQSKSQCLDIFGVYMKLGSSSPDSDKNCLFRTYAKTVIMQFQCLRFICTILLYG